MKPLLFKVPTVDDRTFRIEHDSQPYFYKELHFHPEVQLTLIQEGEGTLIVGDTIDRFGQYDIFLLGSNLPHVLRSDSAYFEPGSQQRSTATSVLFRAETLENTFLSVPEMRPIRQLLQEAQHGIRLRGQPNHPLVKQLATLPALRPFEQLIGLLTLLDALAAHSDRQLLSGRTYLQPQRPEDHQRLERVFSHLLDHYDRPVTLDEVASLTNMTPGAFCRFFRQHTRKTFTTLLNEVRIEHACRYLRESKLSISQIAFSCGYTNLSNFNRQFKEKTGVTPSAYLRLYSA